MNIPKNMRPDLSLLYKKINHIFPLELADTSWDNVGVLLNSPEPPYNSQSSPRSGILLATDLTRRVTLEALTSDTRAIVLYHPCIFRGLKALSADVAMSSNIIQLIQHGIDVICLHTAADATVSGTNDYLITSCVSSGLSPASFKGISSSLASRPIIPSSLHDGAGMGRILETMPLSIATVIKNLKQNMDVPHVAVALATQHKEASVSLDNASVSSIAVCAGSGGSILSKAPPVDLWVTGELSHHEALAATENGTSVILLKHSASERPWLRYYRDALQDAISGTPFSHVACASADQEILLDV